MDKRDRKPHLCKRRYQEQLFPCEVPHLRFVMHQHHATSMHYDFRLELGGALRDFVIPDGPSTDPKVSRHAISYYDHQLRCLTLEGNTESGPMIIWDEGVYKPCCTTRLSDEEAVWAGHDEGYLIFELFGQKLKGKWKLVYLGRDWALQKVEDAYASSDNILLRNQSVVSGKRIDELYRKVVMWVELMEFYVDAVDKPQVIHRGDMVLDANALARKRGVSRGLLTKQARAILSEGEFIPWEEEKYLRKQADWLDLCIAFSSIIEPADQHAAWIDLSAHPDPIHIGDELFRTLQRATKLTVCSGIAGTKWLAQLASKYDDCGPALRSPSAFLAGLPVQELLPVPIECRQRLQFLGYSKIGDVAQIPFRVLQEQFDQASYLISSSAKGGSYEPVDAAYPPASILEKFIFEGLAESLEAIQNTIEMLSQRIGKRLELQNLQGCLVSITMEYEYDKTKLISRTFSKPLRDARTVLPSLQLLLEKHLTQPLVSIQILLSELKKVTVEQDAFLEKAGTRTPRRLETAIKKAQAVFGDSSVKLGKEIELPRRVYVLREWKNVTGWR